MKISEKQLQMLYQIAIDSCAIVNPIGYDVQTRRNLVNEIINQQDREIIKVGGFRVKRK